MRSIAKWDKIIPHKSSCVGLTWLRMHRLRSDIMRNHKCAIVIGTIEGAISQGVSKNSEEMTAYTVNM